MNKGNEKSADELLICYKFPPSQRVSGVVYAKRLIKSQKILDIIQGPNGDEELDINFNEIVDKFVNKRFITKSNVSNPTWNSIKKFIEEGMKILEENGDIYKKIYSRAGAHESHFLALDYKLKHPETFWTAEFSDPLSITIDNEKRGSSNKDIYIKDEYYINKINAEIKNMPIEDLDLRMIDEELTIFELCEYLPFLFADEIIFTNENQMELMLDFYPEIKELVKTKSKVDYHPTLDKEYYHVVESDYKVDKNYINFGYFGTILGKRHLENIFYAFESLNPQFKEKYMLHIFAQNKSILKKLTKDLNISDNLIINDKVPLLEFLNLTTKFDVLIVNDLNTYDNFEKNPFLPSKLADYLGSGNDIWGIYEKGSIMSQYNLKYKSDVADYESSLQTLKNIFKDKIDLNDEGIDINSIDGDLESYLETRIYQLNSLIGTLNSQKESSNEKLKKERKKNSKLKKENKKMKNEIRKIKPTKGWMKYKVKNIISRTKKKI